jgi:hypothetical protein
LFDYLKKHASVALAFVIGTVFGGGAYWQWKQSEIAAEKQRLDAAAVTTELRGKENDLYGQIVNLTNDYVKNQASAPAGDLPHPQVQNEMLQERIHLGLLKDDFNALEAKLAVLENRKPRDIALDFIPPRPPTGLTATVQ